MVTPHFYRIGTQAFPAYLSVGDQGMIIEGGTGPTTRIMIDQIHELGIKPERITHVALTHTHADHIGALPHLKLLWPHIKITANPIAARALCGNGMIKPFLYIDQNIGKVMLDKGEIDELPPVLETYAFDVDQEVHEGETIALGQGIEWTAYQAPGHSPCHMGWFEQKEKTLVIGDTTGFYVPEKDVFWPNYFESLEKYCSTISKLAALPAKRAALSHNCIIEGKVREHFQKAMKATERYHTELMERLAAGEDPEKLAREKAEWVNSLTDIQPFEAMLMLSKLLIKRSQMADGKTDLFSL